MSKFFFYVAWLQCLFVTATLANSGHAQQLKDTHISNNWKKVKLEAAFADIQSQTDYFFTYDSKQIEYLTISSTEENLPLLEVLKFIASRTGLNFSISDDLILVEYDNTTPTIKNVLKKEITLPPLQQLEQMDFEVIYQVTVKNLEDERIIKGNVTGEDGEPLVGATVQVKDSRQGTVTDMDGAFSIVAPDEGEVVLMVSFIGFAPREVAMNNRSNVTVVLKENLAQLDEIVVIGYGTETKEKFNGAISKTEGETLNKFSSANFEQALAGTLAGVQVIGNGKNPGDNSVIQIRGVNTLTAGTSPLIVVDGVPLTEGSSFSSVNTNDIESVSVLKDAASAAIYGSRASNGVILITTKKGEAGQLKITYDGYFGVQQRIDKFELTDAYNTALFDYDARNFGYISGGAGRSASDDNATRDANGGGKRSRIPSYLQAYLDGQPGLTNTNWGDEVFRAAQQQEHYLNLRGGSSKTDYSVSFGYFDQENIIVASDYERYTTNFKLNAQLSDRIRFGIATNLSLFNSNPTGEAGWSRSESGSGRQADPAFTIVLMQPYYPIYNADGSFAIAAQLDDNNQNWDAPISENTIAQAELSDFTREGFRAFGNTFLEVEPLRDLTFKTSFGGDYNTGVEEYFGPSIYGNYRTPVENNPTQAAQRNSRRENFITENTLNYKKEVGVHSFNALVGYSYQQEFRNQTNLESQDFADDNLRNIAGATSIAATSRSSKWALESYFSRFQYAFDNRYSLAASLRRDGSSRFGANTKYGNFASLSAGWTLSNESFFPKNNLVSFAKLRGSWGQTGNNQIGDFASIALISPDNYVVDGSLTSGVYTSTSPNADLSWETNSSVNLGVDLGFLENKLLLTLEYFASNTKDLLLDVPVPQQSGFSESLQNIGELKNTGLELELNGRGFKLGKVSFGFNVNFTTTENEVLALGDGQEQIISSNGVDFITRVGDPIAQFYNYQVIGVYKNQAELEADPITPLAGTEVGDYMVRDADGDGMITPNDRVIQGDYNPDFTYGIGVSMNYKGFDFGLQFYGVEGRKVSDNMVNRSESGEGFFVPTQYYFDNYFNDRNPNGFFRRPDFSSFSSAGRLTRKSNLSVLDGDYFRLRSLQLGYTLPSTLTERYGIQGVRLYVTGNNLFNFTNYRGFNSDGLDVRSNERQTLTRGYIYSTSPLTRFIAFGVNANF